jgi:hypothetical protein
VEKQEARAFNEVEAIKNNWSVRELERQINSLFYERLAKSRDKAGLMKLALKGQEVTKPFDAFKDPVIIEFLGLPESLRLVESDLEQASWGSAEIRVKSGHWELTPKSSHPKINGFLEIKKVFFLQKRSKRGSGSKQKPYDRLLGLQGIA